MTAARPAPRRRLASALAVLLVPALLAACQQAQADDGPERTTAASTAPSPTTPAPQASVEVSPADGTADGPCPTARWS